MNPEFLFAVLPPGPRAALAFALQGLLLFYPAWRLAGRDPARVPVAIGLLLTLSALSCWLLDRYAWPVAAALPAFLGIFFISFNLYRKQTKANLVRERIATSAPVVPGPGPWILAGITAILAGGLLLNIRAPLSGWDAMTYHIEFPLQWIQAGRFEWGVTGYGDESPPYYPALSGLWFGWWLLGGPGASGLTDATGIFWWLVLWLGLRSFLFLREDARARPALTEGVAFWIASVPYFTSATLTAENDLMLAACFILAWRAFELVRLRGLSLATVLECGLACGLLAAVKFTALPYLGALLLAYGFARARAGKLRFSRAAALLLPGIAACLAGGGWWYLRNLFYAGNPVYPGEIRLPVLDLILYEGYSTTAFFAAHPFHAFSPRALFSDPAFGPLLLTAGVLALLPGRTLRERLAPFALPALVLAAFWFFVPLRMPRLLGPLAVALGPALLDGLGTLPAKPRANNFALAVVGAGGVLNALLFAMRLAELYGDPFQIQLSLTDFTRATVRYGLSHPAAASVFVLYLLAIFGPVLIAVRFALRWPKHWSAGAFVFMAATILLATFLIQPGDFNAYQERAGPQGRAWEFLDRLQATAATTRRVGLVGSNALTPLRGPNCDRPLVLVHSRPEEDRPLFARSWGFQHGAELQRPAPERELFEEQLARHRIDILFITTETGVTPPRWHPEREWARALNWRPLFADAGVEIFAQEASQ